MEMRQGVIDMQTILVKLELGAQSKTYINCKRSGIPFQCSVLHTLEALGAIHHSGVIERE